MTLALILSAYINLNLLIALGFLALASLNQVLRFAKRTVSSRNELGLHYAALSLVIGFAIVNVLLPKNEFFHPAAKIWAAPSLEGFNQTPNYKKSGYLTVEGVNAHTAVSTDLLTSILFGILALLVLSGVVIFLRDLSRLYRVQKKSYLVRKIAKTRIYLNDDIAVPFSFRLPNQINVVLPSTMALRPDEFQISLVHELQHHRQGDTYWVYVILLTRLLCPANPFAAYWSRWIFEVQEFACDETLVDQNKVESQAYARCLVEVAQTAIGQRGVPVCATGLTFLIKRNFLKRRLEKMLNQQITHTGRSIRHAFVLGLASLMAVTAFASKSVIQDRRVSIEQATAMARQVQTTSGFPVVVTDLVLKQLNRFIGTPEGRAFMRDSLARMENYRPLIERKIREYGTPIELMAIPLIESGYQNLPESNQFGTGAGLWMFIVSTAQRFGLRVDSQVDERQNVELLTDVAMRYLQSNYLRFKDWPLAVLSYNVGEDGVQKAMNKTGLKDAWSLIRHGYENDRDYLPKLMAAILIMQNPDSVK